MQRAKNIDLENDDDVGGEDMLTQMNLWWILKERHMKRKQDKVQG